MTTLRTIPCVLLTILAANAQPLPIWQGVSIGNVYDEPSRTIRPIVGILGASYLGTALRSDLLGGSISPDGKWLVWQTSNELRIESTEGKGTSWTLENVPSSLRFAWDPTGKDLLAAADGNKYLWHFIRDEQDWKRVEMKWPNQEGELELLAWDSVRREAWISLRQQEQRLILRQGYGQAEWEAVPPELTASALSFSPKDGQMGYLIDAAKRKIVEFNPANPAEHRVVFSLAEEQTGASLLTLRVLDENRLLYAVDGASPVLVVWNLKENKAEQEFPLDTKATRIQPLGLEKLFVLNSRSAEDDFLLVVDLERTNRVYFVPAGGSR